MSVEGENESLHMKLGNCKGLKAACERENSRLKEGLLELEDLASQAYDTARDGRIAKYDMQKYLRNNTCEMRDLISRLLSGEKK